MRIAVTGGIATGKSTIVAELASAGFVVASADEVASEVRSDALVRAQVADALGLEPTFDQDALGRTIATDPEARVRLNAIFHPEIFRRMVLLDADVFELPLLFETCLQRFFEVIIVASCQPVVQVERVVARGGTLSFAAGIVSAQLPDLAKTVFADYIVRTDQPLKSVLSETRRLAQALR